MPRTAKERAVDLLLTSYLIHDAFNRCNVDSLSETKLQKLIFLSEKLMIDQHHKGFNYHYIRLTHGPYSPELRSNLGIFIQIGALNESNLEPTNYIKNILEDFNDVICKNNIYIEKINAINNTFSQVPLSKLLKFVYSMPWGIGKKIKDLSQRTPMLYPMKTGYTSEFELNDNEVEDLLMNFDPEALENLEQSSEDMRKGRILTYEQIFTSF